MQIIGLDTETTLITEEQPVPDLVCMSVADLHSAHLFDRHDSINIANDLLRNPDVRLVIHNAKFDLQVLMKAGVPRSTVFDALNGGRVICTQIQAKLYDCATRGIANVKGWYSLAKCAERHLKIHVEKEDTWRLRYGELIDIPIEHWPQDAKDYALDDARYHLLLHLKLCEKMQLPDLERQTVYDLWLGEASNRGMLIDASRAYDFVKLAIEKVEEYSAQLSRLGILEIKGDNRVLKQAPLRDLVSLAYARNGKQPPRTKPTASNPKGQIKTDAGTLQSLHDPTLALVSDYKRWADVLSKDAKILAKKFARPYYGLANSGRTTASNPNTQNMKKDMPIRQCFIPRPGFVYIICDYSGLELHTLAQVCIKLVGYSILGDALNSGKDPHSIVAAQILGIPYEEAVKRCEDPNDSDAYNARQTGKVANFGLPGGMGIDAFISFAWSSYGVVLTQKQAMDLRDAWRNSYPEMPEFFRVVSNFGDQVTQLFSGRIRYNKSFTSSCNTLFQGLGADVAKFAGWLLHQACFDESSPLFGSHIVNFEHDCFIVETPYDPERPELAHNAAKELSRIMVEGPSRFVPDVPLKAKPCLALRWDKKAIPVYNDQGILIPWGD